MPFVIIRDGEPEFTINGQPLPSNVAFSGSADLTSLRTYHVWFFGLQRKMPFESRVVPADLQQLRDEQDALIRSLREQYAPNNQL
jgi:hypothetical protein